MTAESGAYQYLFTVFTATYNRAGILPRVYESLKAQTLRDFEWLIVDDGSTDGTGDLVASWQREADFPIRYVWKENQGLMASFNQAVPLARGELFLQFDSDDACVPNALERFKYHWDTIPDTERAHFSAVTALCVDERGALVGRKFPRDVTDSDSLEMRYRFKATGEKWGFHRTDVLKQHPFPVVEGETAIPEWVVWSSIARKYRTRFVNEPLRVYYSGDEGYSRRRWARAINRSRGLVALHESVLNNDIGWFRYAPKAFLRSALHYSRFSLHSGRGLMVQVRGLSHPLSRLLWLLMLPLAAAVYLRDRRRLT